MRREGNILSDVAWSLTWAIGVALGVALGAYLTVQGSAAAPGLSALGYTELVTLPLAAGALAFVVVFVARLFFGIVRTRVSPSPGD